jgi:hypothetical protein
MARSDVRNPSRERPVCRDARDPVPWVAGGGMRRELTRTPHTRRRGSVNRSSGSTTKWTHKKNLENTEGTDHAWLAA